MYKNTTHNDSTAVGGKLPCDSCGSSDAVSMYDDGHLYCYSCGLYTPPSVGETQTQVAQRPRGRSTLGLLTEDLQVSSLKARGITEETCKKFSYKKGSKNGRNCQVAPYYKEGKLVGQKLRYADKSFEWTGKAKGCELFGQHLWKNKDGKRLVITEGEIDCLSVSQAFGNTWATVSVPSGAQTAKKSIMENLEFVESFETVVLMFDNDEAGKKAVEDCIPLLSVGKVQVVTGWPDGIKDANDLLQQGRSKDICKLVWDASEYRPDGIVTGKDVSLKELLKPIEKGVPYKYPKLQNMTYGARKGEISLWTAGSGIGKSTIFKELMFDYRRNHNMVVGGVFLEESVTKTMQSLIALDNNTPLAKLRHDPSCIPLENFERSKKELLDKRCFFYDHFGSLDGNNLLTKLRYLAVSLQVDYIFLDHISIVVSGNETGDERKDLDVLMTNLRTLCENTGVGIHIISHLKRTQKNFNEGGQISLSDLRGSASLEQLSDNVYAIERNQQSDDDEDRNTAQIRVLKCRESGNTGVADRSRFNPTTGRHLPLLEEEGDSEMFNTKINQEENEDF